MVRIISLLTLLICLPVCGQDVVVNYGYKIGGIENPQVIAGMLISSKPAVESVPVGFVEIKTDAAIVQISATDQASRFAVELKEVGKNQWMWTKPGKVELQAEALDFDKRIWFKKTVIGELPGVSPAPTPPGPTPPTPPPGPTPAPQVLSDLSGLIIYESADLPAYSAALRSVINSTELRKFSTEKIGGRLAVLDKDTKFQDKCDTVWCKWLAGPAVPSLPWLILGNKSVQVFSGPLPDSEAAVQSLISKHSAGAK